MKIILVITFLFTSLNILGNKTNELVRRYKIIKSMTDGEVMLGQMTKAEAKELINSAACIALASCSAANSLHEKNPILSDQCDMEIIESLVECL